MDFFSQQEKAKRYTKVLLLYFLMAIALIVVAVNIVIYYFFMFVELYPYTASDWFSNGMVYYVSAASCLLVLSGSFFRWLKLKSGGHSVAAMVGAKRLNLHTSDARQRQLINVVEEMSIASGVPVPGLYVLESESGINAFVAGYLPTEAVMVVTAGAIEHFTRDEMQGVVAHEFSHILNGDMQINIRLMAMLAGILMISSVGRLLMSGRNRQHRGRESGGLVVLGFLLLSVGYIGVFFGRIIKSGVSRQREFLADAASVQFTRNPKGIASALNKIREVTTGSVLDNVYTEDMSHMCFAQAFSMRLTKWMATHPPLMDRMKRISPEFVGRVKARALNKKINDKYNKKTESPINKGMGEAVNLSAELVMNFSSEADPVPSLVTAHDFAQTTGKIDQAHIEFATKIHQSFSSELMQAVHQRGMAKMLVLDMILVKMDVESGLKYLKPRLSNDEFNALVQFKGEIKKLENFQRLPLFELMLPTLKLMDENEKNTYINLCEKFIKSDRRYTLYEFVLLSLLKQHLSPQSGADIKIKYYSFKQVNKELQLVFSVMAHSSSSHEDMRNASYEKISQNFPMNNAGDHSGKKLKLLEYKEITPNKITEALKRLSQLSPILKRSVLEAGADIAMYDGQLKYTEAELLRAIADLLNCPLPPLLPS